MTTTRRPGRKVDDVQWVARLHRYRSFADEHGRRPSLHSADGHERTLGQWFRGQLKAGRRGTLDGTRSRLLDEHIPGWLVPLGMLERRAVDRVRQLKVYRDTHGKWPSGRATDPAINDLARWHSNQKQGGGTAKTRALLDAQMPGWNETVQETWERTAQEIATFRARYGELPTASSRVAHVKAWGRWLSDMRRGRGMTPERTAYLDEVLPGWRVGLGHGKRPVQLSAQL